MSRDCMEPISLEDIHVDSELSQRHEKTLKERKLILEKARSGCVYTADFLMQKHRLRVWTWEEMAAYNKEGDDGRN